MSSRKPYFPSDVVSRYYYFRDVDNVLFDPDSVSAEVYNPSKTKMAPGPSIEKVSVGKYEFNYTLPSDASQGWWRIYVNAVKAETQKSERFMFPVLQVP